MEFSIKTGWLSFLVVVFLCRQIQESSAIKCWVCRSDIDPACADPFDNTTLAMTDCNHVTLHHLPHLKSTMCRKIIQNYRGKLEYYRSCAFLEEAGSEGKDRYCYTRTTTNNISMEYCTCKNIDGCNEH